MRRFIWLVSISVTFVGCGGTFTFGEDIGYRSIGLISDSAEALQMLDCVSERGEACPHYPNPGRCASVEVTIEDDGRTEGICLRPSGSWERVSAGIADGVPIGSCTKDTARDCMRCVDIYGIRVYDECDRETALHVPQQSDAPPPPPSSPPSTGDRCDPRGAHEMYAVKLNEILISEGFGSFTYTPDAGSQLRGADRYFKFNARRDGDICEHFAEAADKGNFITECDNKKEEGRCHCKGESDSTRCRCGRMNVFALQSACKAIPTDCEREAWVGELVKAYGEATVWLTSGTYKTAATSPPWKEGSPAPPVTVAPPSFRCLGSPLVLDLEGDGIAPIGPGRVHFDLLGGGPQPTGWIQGDDALLVLDRNGNGTIDSGNELFGEVSGGSPATDGFAALAELDRPIAGGDANGVIDAGDAAFAKLRVWRDHNVNGLTEPGELSSLAEAGVRELSLAAERRDSSDVHGNDLSLQGTFRRSDGSRAAMIDVLFIGDR